MTGSLIPPSAGPDCYPDHHDILMGRIDAGYCYLALCFGVDVFLTLSVGQTVDVDTTNI